MINLIYTKCDLSSLYDDEKYCNSSRQLVKLQRGILLESSGSVM